MAVKTSRNLRSKPFGFALVLLSAILLLYLVDYGLIGYDYLNVQFVPKTLVYWLRTMMLFLTTLYFVGFLIREHRRNPKNERYISPNFQIQLFGKYKLSISQMWISWGSLLFAAMSTVLFLFNPDMFYEFGREDQPVELLSALFAILGGLGFVYLIVKMIRGKVQYDLFLILTFGFFALAFILIGLEEISWFQRTFWVPTPEFMAGNLQNEINLHNFATNQIEDVYYFSAFLFLIGLPFINYTTNYFQEFPKLAYFIPGIPVLLISAPLVAFNYTEWNMGTVQVAFFATVLMVIYLGVRAAQTPGSVPAHPLLLFTLAFIILGAQVIFIVRGETFVRYWDVSEYKELFIPLGFFVYSLEILMKTVKIIPYRIILVFGGTSAIFAVLRLIQKYTMQ